MVLESYVVENYIGFSYGLPLINYVATSWIPSRIFPEKYFIIDWLANIRSPLSNYFERILIGTKSSLFGSFYSEGGLIGVILLSYLMGYLSRKLDGMTPIKLPSSLKLLGISWLSVLWMVWGSSDTGG